LTDTRVSEQWFIPGTFGTTVGAHYQLRPAEDTGLAGPIDVEVLEAVEEQRLVMQWTGERLHTEMTWALLGTAGGSRLSVVQSGFIGTPQSVRRAELRKAYTILFMQALPTVLDQLAAAVPDAVPEVLGSAAPRLPRLDRPATKPIGFLARFARWPGRWRFLGTAAAVVAILALAVTVLVVGLSGGESPNQVQPPPQPLGDAAVATPGAPDTSPASGAVPASQPGTAPAPRTSAPGAGPVPVSPGMSPTPAAPTELAASYQTTKVSGAGAYVGQITISTTGPGTVDGWTVVVTLGGSSRVNLATGASFAQSGQTITFTPSGNARVSAGSPVSFTFHVNRKNDGVAHPLTCRIGGQDCAMLSL
jgi:uncharacterized protein YndB with AHSA1/START domain